MINTTSTASTPICSPQLPPEIVMNAGALQPFAVRQVATPLPPLPPKTKPPLTMCGTTAMHSACSNTSSGIPLSGIPIISCSTLVAFSSRSVASSRADPAQHSVPRLNIASKNITLFIEQPHFLPQPGRQAVWCGGQIFPFETQPASLTCSSNTVQNGSLREPSNTTSSQSGFSRFGTIQRIFLNIYSI